MKFLKELFCRDWHDTGKEKWVVAKVQGNYLTIHKYTQRIDMNSGKEDWRIVKSDGPWAREWNLTFYYTGRKLYTVGEDY